MVLTLDHMVNTFDFTVQPPQETLNDQHEPIPGLFHTMLWVNVSLHRHTMMRQWSLMTEHSRLLHAVARVVEQVEVKTDLSSWKGHVTIKFHCHNGQFLEWTGEAPSFLLCNPTLEPFALSARSTCRTLGSRYASLSAAKVLHPATSECLPQQAL
eukprot:3345516-Rhodomonas_salina.1